MKTATVTFTLDEANNTLPLVSRIGKDIHETYIEITDRQPVISAPRGTYRDAVVLQVSGELELLLDKINGHIAEIEALGAIVERFKRCAVLFPTESGVQLIWALGEDGVTHWKMPRSLMDEALPIETAPSLVSE